MPSPSMPATPASRPDRWRLVRWTAPLALLLVPALANGRVDGVVWTASDFVVMGAMLYGVVGLYELGLRRAHLPGYRTALALGLAAAFLLVYAIGAVGVFDGHDAPFAAVFVVAGLGALAARFRPRGMAWAMGAAGLVHAAVAVGSVALGHHLSSGNSAVHLLAINAVYVGLWFGSAVLFHRAAAAEDTVSA